MELREFFKLLNKHRSLITTLTVSCGLVALFYSLAQPTRYEANTSVYIRREAEKPNDRYYTYDGYYSQQAAKEYTDTVVGLLKTTDITRRAVELANLTHSPKELSASLRIKKVSPQVVNLSIIKSTDIEASQVLTAVVNALSERVGVFSAQGDSKFLVGAINNNPLISKVSSFWYIYLAAGLLLGFGLGLVIPAFKQYSRS